MDRRKLYFYRGKKRKEKIKPTAILVIDVKTSYLRKRNSKNNRLLTASLEIIGGTRLDGKESWGKAAHERAATTIPPAPRALQRCGERRGGRHAPLEHLCDVNGLLYKARPAAT